MSDSKLLINLLTSWFPMLLLIGVSDLLHAPGCEQPPTTGTHATING